MFKAFPVPILSDNYTWVLSGLEPGTAVVVDPGEAAPVLSYLESSALMCGAVFLTHHHGDHVGGALSVSEYWKCPVYGPTAEAIPAVTHPIAGRDTVAVAGMNWEVLGIPGHTHGHVAYVGHGHLFCGDTLFAGGCGRIFEGTPKQMYESLMKLASLGPETRVCCAHEYTIANLQFALRVEPGNKDLVNRLKWAQTTRAAGRPTVPSSLKDELATNPFLRGSQPEIVAQASRHAGRRLKPGLEVFTEIRAWKDKG